MDNLTHTALGLFLSRAGMNRWTPRATPILLLAANAPDLDVACAAAGSLNYLNYHRHLTHAFIALPFLALLCVALVRVIGRKPVNWLGGFAAAAIGVATHLALDWTNIYGIRLLLPFSDEWFRGDLTSVVDLFIWAVLLLSLAGPFLSRLVNAEIGASNRGRPYGRGWAWFALLFVLSYNVGRFYLHTRAAAMLDARLYDGEAPRRVLAIPSAANPLHWRGVVETSETYSVHQLNLVQDFDPGAGTVYRKADPSAAIEAARRDPTLRDFLAFSQFPILQTTPLPTPAGATRVDAVDMRFGTPTEPGFAASVTLDASLRVIASAFQFGRVRVR